MALLPYTKRVATQRGPRGGRGEQSYDSDGQGAVERVVTEDATAEAALAAEDVATEAAA